MSTPPADTNANCQAQTGFSIGSKGPLDSIVAGHGGGDCDPLHKGVGWSSSTEEEGNATSDEECLDGD